MSLDLKTWWPWNSTGRFYHGMIWDTAHFYSIIPDNSYVGCENFFLDRKKLRYILLVYI